MEKNLRNNLAFAAAFVLLAACGTAPKDPHIPVMTFQNVRSAPIAVARMSVVDQAIPSEVDFVVSPRGAMETYLNRRFLAQGFEGELRAVIEEAQVAEGFKQSDSGVAKFFDVAGNEEYTIHIRIRLEHIDNTGLVRYSNVMNARRVIRVSEHASVDDRERRQLEGLDILFQDIDREASRIVLNDMRLAL